MPPRNLFVLFIKCLVFRVWLTNLDLFRRNLDDLPIAPDYNGISRAFVISNNFGYSLF